MRLSNSQIEQHLQDIGHEAFPDNTDVRWELRDVVERGGFICAQAAPVPATVGYPEFRFVLHRGDAGALIDHACFCLSGGVWQLLYTTPDTREDWRALAF